MTKLRNFYLGIAILFLFVLGQTVDAGVLYFPSSSTVTLTGTNLYTSTSLNEFSGQTNISGPDATTNVEIGSVANDANAGTGGTSVVIGNSATNAVNNVAMVIIGSGANASGAAQGSTVIIGTGANTNSGGSQVVIGANSTSANNNGIAIGASAATTGNPAIAIGSSASASTNQIVIGSSITASVQKTVYFGWGATTVATAGATPVNITSSGGTGTDNPGAPVSLSPGPGTGAAGVSAASINRNLALATGTTVQSQAPAYVACPTKILSNTSATAQTIATITTTTTSGGAVSMFYTVVASNGTLVDSDSGMTQTAWNNNAGTVAATMAATVGGANSVASGTLASLPTATVATNVISVKLTPTWTVIVPTLVTGFVTFQVNGVNTVDCQ